ncbi:MAG: MBL fold metallo-hydrolase [Cyclobacteriaceae bacterium]|nr:MBL fold metallo-hydrolase [Cyclobacteriaceae bacterium]
MKTIKITGTLLLIVFTCAFLTAQERETVPVSLEKITESVYQINGGQGANGGVIIGESEVLVIDAKMDEESVIQTIVAIKEIADEAISYLVNTHSDGDHIMGNRYFPSSVTFVAHKNCRDDFFKENFGRESDWDQPEFYPFTPSLTFKKNLNMWLGKEKVELHYFGVGHTTGDIVVFHPEQKVAFIGDLYFSGRPQLVHSNKNGNSFKYVKTMMQMLEKLDAEIFLSGHSDPVGREEIEKHIQVMVERQNKVKEFVSQDKSLEETLKEFTENEPRLVTSIYNEITEQEAEQSTENPY